MEATHALWLLALPVGAITVGAIARRFGLSAPIVLVLAGVVVSLVPVVPAYVIDPDLVLFLILPPLLYAAALDSSYLSVKDNRRPIGLLSIGLVLFTTFVIGYVAYLLIPGIPLAVAFALGAIVAPPDAVAAVSIARRLGLPRRTLTILVGESLFNDATALTAFRIATAAAVGHAVSQLTAVGEFLLAAVGGVAIGLVIAPVLNWLRHRQRDPLVESAVSLLVPFAAYLAAEAVHVSGVLSVVVVGLLLGHARADAHFATRLQDTAVWAVAVFVLESTVFALIGLQLLPILRGLNGWSGAQLVGYAVAVFGTAVAARFVWCFPAAYLPRWLSRRIREREPTLRWQQIVVVSWAGMRGVVSLAAAFAIPETVDSGAPFPHRDLLLFLTFCVVFGTLVIQGMTFPMVIRRLGIGNEQEVFADTLAYAAAQQEATTAALRRLGELADGQHDPPLRQVVDRLHKLADHRQNAAWERLGGGTGPDGTGETPSASLRRLRREMVAAERATLQRLRDDRRIDDEVFRRLLYELDLEEAMLDRDQLDPGSGENGGRDARP